ncbi:hypothetical protein [Deinococcus marmoris]|nr:hypothetical protein [Deinococcus marmoris]
MPFPLIWVVGVMAVGAIKKGADAGMAFSDAKSTHEKAEVARTAAQNRFAEHMERVRQASLELEEQKHAVMDGTVKRFVELWKRQKKNVNISDKDFALKLNITPEKLEELKFSLGIQGQDVVKGVTQVAVAGMATGMGVSSAVTAFGAASTGAAITGLSGAAANSAALAWLGGGTLAAGGGGMALGAIVATGLFAAPAALAGTFIAAKKGQEALTAATKYSADVQEYCVKVHVAQVGLTGIESRMQEVGDLIKQMVVRVRSALAQCEADEAELGGAVRENNFFMAATLVKTLTELLSVPIIDADITATAASKQVVAETRRTL